MVYALPVASKWTRIEYERNGVERKFPYCDYEIKPLSNWNYAFASKHFTVQEQALPEDYPFSEQNPPLVLEANMVPIDWGHMSDYEDLCSEYPQSVKRVGEIQRMTLIPYGCTTLRMTEMPFADDAKEE